MLTASGPSSRDKSALLILAAVALGRGCLLIGRATEGPARVDVVRGTVAREGLDGVGVRLADREDPDAVFFVGTAQSWTDTAGSGHDAGQPVCLPPDSRGAVVELGVVPEVEGGYSNEVVWVRCITLPTGFVLGDDVTALPLDH